MRVAAERIVDWYMEFEPEESFDDLQNLIVNLKHDGARTMPQYLQTALELWCDENSYCPECGEKCTIETVVLGVHPYGSTTATEYGGVRVCEKCGWRDDA